jgi:WD40 repeat protein
MGKAPVRNLDWTDYYGDALPAGAIARAGTVRFCPRDGVSCCCFLPDGLTLATGGFDGIVVFWDAATGRELRAFSGHKADICSLAFSPNGRIMASASSDTTVRLWDVVSGKQLHALSHATVVLCCIFSPDGKILITSDRRCAMRQWETMTWKELPPFAGHENFVLSLGCTSDGRTLVSCGSDHTVRLWEVATTQQRRLIQLSPSVHSVAVSSDGKLMAMEMKEKTIDVLEIATGKVLQTIPSLPNTASMAFSLDGHIFVNGSQEPRMRIWDIASRKIMFETQHVTITSHTGPHAFSPDGRLLAATDGHRLHLWEVRTGAPQMKVPTPRGVTVLNFSPDGRTLITGSIDQTVRLWNADTGEELLSAKVGGTVAAFSRDCKVAAAILERPYSCTQGSDTVCLYDVFTGDELHTLKHNQLVRGVAYSPDGTTLAVAEWSSPGMIYLWATATGKEIRRFGGGPAIGTIGAPAFTMLPVAYSPDGRILACGCSDCTVRLWEVATGRLRCELGQWHNSRRETSTLVSGVTCLAFSADGNTLTASVISPGNHGVYFWDVASGRRLPHELHWPPPAVRGWDRWVSALAFSPDGKRLAAARLGDRTIHLWDITAGIERQCLVGHRGEIFTLAFSSDGKVLASGSLDGTALIWDGNGTRG